MRCKAGIKPTVSQNPGLQGLQFLVCAKGKLSAKGIAAFSLGVENIVFNIMLRKQLTDSNTDFSRAACSAGGIDLDDFHSYPLQKGT